MADKKNFGTSMGGMEHSPNWIKRRRKNLKRQNENWAKKSSEVIVTTVDPSKLVKVDGQWVVNPNG